jgi:hypothetical protein
VRPHASSEHAGLSFSPDGRVLAVTTGDGAPRVLRCEICGPIDHVLALAGGRVTRELTDEERKLYLNTSNRDAITTPGPRGVLSRTSE